MRPTVATIHQEMKDFKRESFSRSDEMKQTLHSINEQTRKTNGRVTQLEFKESVCPAKQYFKGEPNRKDWKIMISVGVISTFSALITALVVKWFS